MAERPVQSLSETGQVGPEKADRDHGQEALGQRGWARLTKG